MNGMFMLIYIFTTYNSMNRQFVWQSYKFYCSIIQLGWSEYHLNISVLARYYST